MLIQLYLVMAQHTVVLEMVKTEGEEMDEGRVEVEEVAVAVSTSILISSENLLFETTRWVE